MHRGYCLDGRTGPDRSGPVRSGPVHLCLLVLHSVHYLVEGVFVGSPNLLTAVWIGRPRHANEKVSSTYSEANLRLFLGLLLAIRAPLTPHHTCVEDPYFSRKPERYSYTELHRTSGPYVSGTDRSAC